MDVFSPGPRLDAPQGDVGRQAVAALRGYAYQIYASAVAWLGLSDLETLHIEVAEDFAVASQEALTGTQVRDTVASGRITLQSEVTRKAIDAFVDLTLRNQGRSVFFHYLTTSEIGLERESGHRIGAGPALLYWRRAAAGANVDPLKLMIAELDLQPATKDYLAGLSDEQFRSAFLSRMHWHCGAPSLKDVRVELEAGLVEFVSTARRLPSAIGRQIVPMVVESVLLRAVSPKNRRLRRSDLLELLDEASRVSVPLAQVDEALTGRSAAFSRASLLVLASDLPLPTPCSPRKELLGSIDRQRREFGALFATGGTGLGKSLTARLVAASAGGNWSMADFRDLNAADTAARLSLLLGEIAAQRPPGVILDDLNEADDPRVRDQLALILASLRRHDATAIVTAYRAPAPSTLHALCQGGVPVVEIPYLELEEVEELVVRAGGDAKFGAPLYRTAAHGHPLMTMSLVLQLSHASWSRQALARLLGSGADGELAAERQAARNRLMAAMPTEVTTLLLRTSLIEGRFDRGMALALGEVAPPVPLAGMALDRLIGAWVEPLARDRFRVSPLLEGAASEVFGEEERRAIHFRIADRILRQEGLAADDTEMLTRHTLASGDRGLATTFASAIITCNEDMLEVVSAFSGTLQRQSCTRPILPEHPGSSGMLRLAQLLTLLPHGTLDAIRSCWDALQREKVRIIGGTLTEATILSKLLLHSRTGRVFPEWLDLLAELDRLMTADERLARVDENFRTMGGGHPHTIGVLFASQMRSIETVSAFRMLISRLDAQDASFRERALSGFRLGRADVSNLVNHGWLRESRTEGFDWEAAASDYAVCAGIAMSWGDTTLAIRCAIAQAICLDENGDSMERAFAVLLEAERTFGADKALVRARAKIHWRRRDHSRALPLLEEAADAADAGDQDALERAYIAREAGISAAELGDWSAAAGWFQRAHAAASKLPVASVRAMAIGLLADIGFASFHTGDPRRAFEKFREATLALSTIDPEGTLAEAYCHRIVRHGTLWLFREVCRERATDEQEVAFSPGSGSNIEPLEAIRDHPILSIDYSIYMLVDIDLSLPEPTGYLSRFRSDLVDGPILSSEISLAIRLGRDMLRDSRSDGFVEQLRLVAPLSSLMRAPEVSFAPDRLMNPIRGSVLPPKLDETADQDHLWAAEDYLLTFGIMATLNGRLPALDQALAAGLAAPEVGALHPMMQRMAGLRRELGSTEREWVAAAINGLRHTLYPTPIEALWGGIWMLLHARATKWRDVVAAPAVAWIFDQWSRLVRTARFLLSAPTLTVPAIEAALADPDRSLAAAARLVLVAAPATPTPVPEQILPILAEIAEGSIV